MKVGLFITNQLHAITQAGYEVTFAPSCKGTVQVEITRPDNAEFFDGINCGKPSGTRDDLEKDIIKALAEFRTIFSIPSTELPNEAADPSSEPKDGGEPEDSDQRDEELDNTGALA